MDKLGYSQRRTCRALDVARSTIRYIPQPREDESALTAAITRLASQYGRHGYRQVHALLMAEGWQVRYTEAILSLPSINLQSGGRPYTG